MGILAVALVLFVPEPIKSLSIPKIADLYTFARDETYAV
jgi:hypothetical protein